MLHIHTDICLCYIGTPLGDKTMEIASKVVTDTAEGLKEATTAGVEPLELEWLETPMKELTPTPEPIPDVPPTPQPSPPPPKVEFHMTQDERRMKKAKG